MRHESKPDWRGRAQYDSQARSARVRHPLYFFEIVTFWGIFLQFRSIEAALLVTAICGVQIARMRFEEKVLSDAFGDYAEYRRAVPFLLPRGGQGLGTAMRQSAVHLVATVLLFAALFAAAFTVLPGPGWRVVQVIINAGAATPARRGSTPANRVAVARA